jgi:glutathione S-transferase
MGKGRGSSVDGVAGQRGGLHRRTLAEARVPGGQARASVGEGVDVAEGDPAERGGQGDVANVGEGFRALRRQALALGMADAGIAARWEAERRPEASRWPPMLQGQLEKIASACDLLEQELGDAPPAEAVPDIGDIALATTLSWIAFRHVYPFADGRPRLSAWYARFSQRPSMLATTLSGDTHD